MWMALAQKDTRTERERYLEDELDSLREQQEREDRRREQEREDKKRARHEEYEYGLRQADTWPSALANQIVLCQREVNDGDDEVDNYFANSIAACETALYIWRKVSEEKYPVIEELEKQIAAIRDSIRLEVADQLEAADKRSQFATVADQMRDDNIARFLDW